MKLPHTHLSAVDIAALQQIVQSLPLGAICAEIGSYLGASAIVIANALPEGGILYCVDTWMNDAMSEGGRDTYAEFMSNTVEHRDRIVALRAESTAAAGALHDELDFLFIDGDHSYEGCRADIKAWLPKVKPGGVIAFHDFGWAKGICKAISESVFPYQEGEGHFLPNLYWAHVHMRQQQVSTPRARLTAHAVVISRRAVPAPEQIAKYEPGLDGLPWSWIAGGTERICTSGVRTNNRPSLHNAGSVGLLAGRHKALEVAPDADILIYLDDDVSLPTGWAEKMLAPFADPEVHLVGCRYLPDYTHEPPSWMEDLWWQRDDGFQTLGHLSLLDGGEEGRFYSPMLVWGLCFAVRRDTVLKLGGFNPDGYPWNLRQLRGDGESGLSAKAEKLGLKAYYQGETHVLHAVPAERMTLRYFECRSFLQGISDSYTAIRQAGVVWNTTKLSWRDTVRPLKTSFLRMKAEYAPTARRVKAVMDRAYIAGGAFHRRAVASDASLFRWVIRATYLKNVDPEAGVS